MDVENLKAKMLEAMRPVRQMADNESESDRASYFLSRAIEELKFARNHCVLAGCSETATAIRDVLAILTEDTSNGPSIVSALELEAAAEYAARHL
jgi:uncharacterized alpha-E superfamily protein